MGKELGLKITQALQKRGITQRELATKMGINVIPYSAYNERIQTLMLKQSEDGFNIET